MNGWNAEEFLQGKMKTYSLMVDGKEKQKISQDELKNMTNAWLNEMIKERKIKLIK